MLKITVEFILGTVCSLAGCILIYIFLNGSEKLWLLLSAFALICSGAFFLIRVEKTFNTLLSGNDQSRQDKLIDASGDNKQKSIIERNNELAREWTDTVEKRDKLRMLKMVASAGEKRNE